MTTTPTRVEGVYHVDDAVAGNGVSGVALGAGAPATTATSGFAYVPLVAGTPTGAPTAATGYAPILVDSTNGRIWAYYGGAWHYAALT